MQQRYKEDLEIVQYDLTAGKHYLMESDTFFQLSKQKREAMETEKLKARIEKLEKKHKNMTIGLFVHDVILIALSVAVSYLFLS